jgi:hypothetical protein
MIPKHLAGFTLAAVALCASLVACEPEGGSEPSPEPGPAVSAPLEAGEPDTSGFLTAARAVAPSLEMVPDGDLIRLGMSVCEAFDAGLTTGQVGAAMTTPGALNGTQAGAVVGAATGPAGLCPEHQNAAHGG